MSGCRSIVMNPPFKNSVAHVRHALQLLPRDGTLAVLLRSSWINAKGRADLLAHNHQEIIAGRLKMLPYGAADRGHGGTTDFSWFIFRRPTVSAVPPDLRQNESGGQKSDPGGGAPATVKRSAVFNW